MLNVFKSKGRERRLRRMPFVLGALILASNCGLAENSVDSIPMNFAGSMSGVDCYKELPRGKQVSQFSQYTLWEIGPLGKSTKVPNREKYLMVVRSPDLECDFFVVDSRLKDASQGRKLHDPRSLAEDSQFFDLLIKDQALLTGGTVLIVAEEIPEFDFETYLISENGVYVDGDLIDY